MIIEKEYRDEEDDAHSVEYKFNEPSDAFDMKDAMDVAADMSGQRIRVGDVIRKGTWHIVTVWRSRS